MRIAPINIPSGLGKTAAVVLAWLLNGIMPTLLSPELIASKNNLDDDL